MTTFKKLLALILTLAIAAAGVPAVCAAGAPADKNLFWPEGRLFPAFAAPEEPLIAFPGDLFDPEETLALACLQGLANAVRPRAVILDGDVETWLRDYGFAYEIATRDNAYDHIARLASDSTAGAVLYATERSREYMNLASTAANTLRAVPLTRAVYDRWTAAGIALPVLEDLRDLPYTKTVDVYRYLYDHYWENCSHRILTVQRTDLPYHMRDLAAAVGGAVVYLSCAGGEETRLFKKFLNSMTPGESILTGWYAGQERELMTVAAQCGLSCVPADFFSNATVFAQNIPVRTPAVPDQPALENKIYIAYFLSDGDNVQYDMHAMRGYWDRNARGSVAVNWTISPALADLAPGMMNYYYDGATGGDCFVCGPSGMGYTMPINTFGGNTGLQFRSNQKFKSYVSMTNGYLERTGLRAVTVWDNLTRAQRRIYATLGTYLYGLTVQHFTDSSLRRGLTGVVDDMLFIQQTPGYFASNAEGTTPITEIGNDIDDAVQYLRYDGTAPVFVAAQASVWAFHDVADIARLERDLSERYEAVWGRDVIEFVRADHFFNLYYEAHGLPLDVTLKSEVTAAASDGSDASMTLDGSCRADSVWRASRPGAQSVTYALGALHEISGAAVSHASLAGEDASANARGLLIETSVDGETWTTAKELPSVTGARSVARFAPVKGAFVRITVTEPGADGYARIADVEIRATGDTEHARCPRCGRIHGSGFDGFLGALHRLVYRLGRFFDALLSPR